MWIVFSNAHWNIFSYDLYSLIEHFSVSQIFFLKRVNIFLNVTCMFLMGVKHLFWITRAYFLWCITFKKCHIYFWNTSTFFEMSYIFFWMVQTLFKNLSELFLHGIYVFWMCDEHLKKPLIYFFITYVLTIFENIKKSKKKKKNVHDICVMLVRRDHIVTRPTHYQLAGWHSHSNPLLSLKKKVIIFFSPRLCARTVILDWRRARFQFRRNRKTETHMSAPLLCLS